MSVNKCCCCVDLRRGVQLIAAGEIAASIAAIAAMLVFKYTPHNVVIKSI